MTLDLYRGQTLDGARHWADLNPEERKRRATEAAQFRDGETLWALTEAHTLLYGGAGGHLSPRTARAYREGIQKFVAYSEGAGLSLVRPIADDGPIYVRWLEGQGLSPASVRVNLAAARALYRALRWAGVTRLDPFSDARPAKDKTAPWDKRQPYTDGEVERLLALAAPRDRALILLCAHGGLRIAEALELCWNDWHGDTLLVRRGKGGKMRRVRCSGSLKLALRNFQVLQRAEADSLVIGASQTAARERLRRLCLQAEVTYRGWHAFRHYAGTRIVRQTDKLEYAARHLGHASLDTTRVYAKWSDQALDQALDDW